jgi:hypothetical protein
MHLFLFPLPLIINQEMPGKKTKPRSIPLVPVMIFVMAYAIATASVIPAVISQNVTVSLTMDNTQATVHIPGEGDIPADELSTKYTRPSHWYLASYLNDVLHGMVLAYGTPSYLETSKGSSSHTIRLSSDMDSRILLIFTEGDWRALDNRISMIEAGEFLSKVSPSFSYGLGFFHPVKAVVELQGVDILNDLILSPGTNEISIEYPQIMAGRPVLYINRTI